MSDRDEEKAEGMWTFFQTQMWKMDEWTARAQAPVTLSHDVLPSWQ
jgi:hypothetical protein